MNTDNVRNVRGRTRSVLQPSLIQLWFETQHLAGDQTGEKSSVCTGFPNLSLSLSAPVQISPQVQT